MAVRGIGALVAQCKAVDHGSADWHLDLGHVGTHRADILDANGLAQHQRQRHIIVDERGHAASFSQHSAFGIAQRQRKVFIRLKSEIAKNRNVDRLVGLQGRKS